MSIYKSEGADGDGDGGSGEDPTGARERENSDPFTGYYDRYSSGSGAGPSTPEI